MSNLVPEATAIAPLETIRLPAQLDGRTGTNRATGHAQISAQTDIDAVKAWLAGFLDKRTTFDSYRKETERLLLWTTLECGKPLSSLTHEDLLVYKRFLGNPEPAARWVAKGRKWSRTDPRWRPFAGPLAATSQRQSFVILNTMFSWLVDAGYLAGNPLSLSRQRGRKTQPRVTRFLEDALWTEVKVTIDSMPRETNREREHYHRVRWLFTLLYLCGLRITEVVQNTMGGFFVRRNSLSEDVWWLEVTGKGDKTRLVPATKELMDELARYRRENGLSPYPFSGEITPLLLPIGGKLRPMKRAAVHLIVKDVFNSTATRIRARGDAQSEIVATRVESASAHWLRHTAGSNMANAMDLRNVRDNLGHASIATTNIYLHTEDDQRHEETEANHHIGW